MCYCLLSIAYCLPMRSEWRTCDIDAAGPLLLAQAGQQLCASTVKVTSPPCVGRCRTGLSAPTRRDGGGRGRRAQANTIWRRLLTLVQGHSARRVGQQLGAGVFVAPGCAPGHSLRAAHCSAAAVKAQHLLYTSQPSVRHGAAGHDDYRDRLPTPLDDVVREYKDVVKVTTLLLEHSLLGCGAHVLEAPTAARRVDLWFVPVLGQAIQGARFAALLCRWPVSCCDAGLTCAPARRS